MAWWKLKSGQNGKSTDLQSDHSGDGWIEWDDNGGDQETNQGEGETKRDGPGGDRSGESTEEIGLGTGTPYRMLSGTDTGRISISARGRYWTAKLDGSKIKEVIRKLRECGNWRGTKTTKDNNRSVWGKREEKGSESLAPFSPLGSLNSTCSLSVQTRLHDARVQSAGWQKGKNRRGGKMPCNPIARFFFYEFFLAIFFLSVFILFSLSLSLPILSSRLFSAKTQPFQLTSDCVLGTKSIASLGIQNRQLLSMKNSTQIDCANVSSRKFS